VVLAPSPIAGETPIFVATESNHAGVVPFLNYFLSRGGDPAAPDARGCTPLHNAAEHGALISHSRIHLSNFLE
jgi:ankyrin repeat protein